VSFFDWNTLRTKPNLTDDVDHVDLQTSPPSDELRTVPSVGDSGLEWPGTLEAILEFVDALGAPVLGAGRGSADVQFVKIVERADGTATYVDTVPILATPSYRSVFVDDVRTGTQYWVRLTNISAPAGSAGVIVYCKEQPQE